MALQVTVETLDNVPEALRSEYVEKDGKFHLNVEGLDTADSLRAALKKERDFRYAFEGKVKAWEKLGKTPEEISELLETLQHEETEKLKKKGDIESLLKQHQDKWSKREQELLGQIDMLSSSERTAIVDERLHGALFKNGATEEGIELLPARLSGRIDVQTVDGKRVLKIMQADGKTPMAGSGADGMATLDDLVKEVSSKYPSLFKGSDVGGGGKRPDGNSGGSGVTKKSDFKSEKARAAWVDKNGFEAYRNLPD
jgi:hypothetical protein